MLQRITTPSLSPFFAAALVAVGPAAAQADAPACTIAPFDDCEGHANLHVGYHYHAVTDCLSGAPTTLAGVDGDVVAAHGGQIGIAMDGYPIFSHLFADGRAPEGLDACHGHETDGLPYHYHAGAAGSNRILGCLKAEAGCVLADAEAARDASVRPPRPR